LQIVRQEINPPDRFLHVQQREDKERVNGYGGEERRGEEEEEEEEEIKTDASLANGFKANVLKALRSIDKFWIRSILVRHRDDKWQSLTDGLC